MFNAYMITSSAFRNVYTAWVKRYYTLMLDNQKWSPEWQQCFDMVARMQRMYDSCENGKIVYLWDAHNDGMKQAGWKK